MEGSTEFCYFFVSTDAQTAQLVPIKSTAVGPFSLLHRKIKSTDKQLSLLCGLQLLSLPSSSYRDPEN
jgi:hypothetical protein